MKKIILIFTLLIFLFGLQAQNKIAIDVNYGVGYDFQTRSNDYNLYGPLIIPSQLKHSILHIEKPYHFSMLFSFKLAENLSFNMNLGKTTRALRYWSIDDSNEDYSSRNDKIDLSISTFNIEPGLRFSTNMDSRINFYWDQSIGVAIGRSSSTPAGGLSKDSKQAELIYLHDKQEAYLVNVNMGIPTLSIISSVGIEYKLFDRLNLIVGMKYVNEVSNGNNIFIWQYNSESDRPTGAYTPYDLEFKSLYSELGLRYKL